MLAGPIIGSSGGGRSWGRSRRPYRCADRNGDAEYEAKRYEGRAKDGGILLSVHLDSSDETKRAKEILEQTGAQDISSTGEASGDKKAAQRRQIA